jgi:hypothetical protein
MEFLVDFNDKLIKRMLFYKNVSLETFNYKKFSSNKSLVEKVVLEGCFKTKFVMRKKDILKQNLVLQLLTNTKPNAVICRKKGGLQIKKKTIMNIKSKIPSMYSENVVKRWFFLLNPFFFENEILSLIGPKSIKKRVDSFKTLRLLNSRVVSGTRSLLNFEVSLKIFFYEEGSSKLFFKNYE